MRHRMLHLVLFFIAALILGPVLVDHASAQIRIRIPRPRPEQVTKPTPATESTSTTQPPAVTTSTPPSPSVSNLAPTGIPSSIILDDGFTFFTLHNKKDYVGGKPLTKGWSLVSNLRM